MNCNTPVHTYERVRIYIETAEADSFVRDDSIMLYGGTPETINIQYASSSINPFFSNVLLAMRDSRRLLWNINIDEVRVDGKTQGAISGYDLYIFEDTMPEIMPTDGVVLLVNPMSVPAQGGFLLDSIIQGDFSLSAPESHEILEGLVPEEIELTRYIRFAANDGFEPLLYVGEDPVLLVKNEEGTKVAILGFSLKYSTFSVQTFPRFFYNLFDYFLPSTVTDAQDGVGFMFEVGDSVKVNARGTDLVVTDPAKQIFSVEELPALLTVSEPGTYSVTQALISGMEVTSNFYVKISSEESDILRTEDELYNPEFPPIPPRDDKDLLMYLAVALAALLFFEWLLQVKENY